MKILNHITIFSIICMSFTACKNKVTDPDLVIPVATLYAEGLELMEKGKYTKAAQEFEKIFFQHPGKEITPKAELMQAYCLYLDGENEESIDVLDIFIKLHPRHESVAYAYYLKALNSYVQISDIELDQSNTRFAQESLQEIVDKFPNTDYAKDAQLKIELVQDRLAAKNMDIGRYYLNKQNPIAAIKRFQIVASKYSGTSHAPEALYRLVEANSMLGFKEEAASHHAILEKNHSDSDWNKRSKNLFN